MSTSAKRVVAVLHHAELSVPLKANLFYPLLIVIGKVLDNAVFILTAREPAEPVIIELQPVEAQQQVVPHRVAVLLSAVACRVPEEAFFLLRFDGFCDLACGIVAPQVLAVFLARRRRSRIGVYLLDYLVGALPPVAALKHQLATGIQHRALGDAACRVVTRFLRKHALAARDFPVQAVAAVRRQRVHRPAVTQLHLQQVTGAVAQRGKLAAIRERCTAEVAERVVLILKLPAVVLLAHQLARGVAGEDKYGVPRRLALFQQRAEPFGARGAADFQRQLVVAVLGGLSVVSSREN